LNSPAYILPFLEGEDKEKNSFPHLFSLFFPFFLPLPNGRNKGGVFPSFLYLLRRKLTPLFFKKRGGVKEEISCVFCFFVIFSLTGNPENKFPF
jgi:hypothetical protein